MAAESTDAKLKIGDGEGSELRSLASARKRRRILARNADGYSVAGRLGRGRTKIGRRWARARGQTCSHGSRWIRGAAALRSSRERTPLRRLRGRSRRRDRKSTILGRIFAQTGAAFAGCEFPSVPAGTAAFPVLSAGPSGSRATKGATHRCRGGDVRLCGAVAGQRNGANRLQHRRRCTARRDGRCRPR